MVLWTRQHFIPVRNSFTGAGGSSWLLTVATVQLSSGLRVVLMLATVVVIVWGFCTPVHPCQMSLFLD